jgi:ABC transport system ATP-binding/permease protein
MNRNVIQALIQLFALVSGNSDVHRRGRIVVEQFLLRLVSRDQLESFMMEFDALIAELHHRGDVTKANKRRSSSSVKVLRICAQLNEELTHAQKGVVLIRLIEFLSADKQLSDRDIDFVDTVASSFHISNFQRDESFSFVDGTNLYKPSDQRIVIIPIEKTATEGLHFIEVEGIDTIIHLFKLPEDAIFFLRVESPTQTTLNGLELVVGEIYTFASGSVLRGPRMKPVYQSDIASRYLQQDKDETIVFSASQIEFRFTNGKPGLHKFSFSETSGHLIGIMGSSGAGKSTLLNILNGNERPSSGEVLINGYSVHDSDTRGKGLIGYVSQDDLLMSELTVFENLWFNAKLCFSKATKTELLRRVHRTLSELGLLEIKDLKVGSPLNKTISGGQRKRLNIAMELIREPTVLFVDEPTSGLSSRDSEHIMDLLKELTLKGKLIFVVIHQPSSNIFKMFDRLILLDTGGYPIYYGNPVEAVHYVKTLADHVSAREGECIECGNINPEQIFDIIENRVVDEYGKKTSSRRISPREWNIFYKREQINITPELKEKKKLPQAGFVKPNRIKQFLIFFFRDLKSKLSNTQYMAINLLEAPLLALIMGYLLRYSDGENYTLYHNLNLPAYLLVCVIASLFFGLTVSAEEIFRDRGILRREKFLNLSRGSYLLSKIAILFILSAIQSGTFVFAGHFVMGIKDLYLSDWLILFSVSCFANVLGLNISASLNSAVTIYILIPLLIIPQLLLSGLLVRYDQLNPSMRAEADQVPIAANIMTSRWAFEALAVNRFTENKAEKPVFVYDRVISNTNYIHNYWVPRMRELTYKIDQPGIAMIVKKEIERMNSRHEFKTFKNTERILKADQAIVLELRAYYQGIWKISIQRENKARISRDSVINSIGENYNELVNNYTNDQLNKIVLRKDQFDKIKSSASGRLVRDFEPVFQVPRVGDMLQGPFYGALKRIAGNYVPTIVSNIIVIWTMTLALMGLLYFDGLIFLIRLPFRMYSRLKKSAITLLS